MDLFAPDFLVGFDQDCNMVSAELLNLLPHHEQGDFTGSGESAGDVRQGFFSSTFFKVFAPLQNFLVIIKVLDRKSVV